jgi:hypothetical protein
MEYSIELSLNSNADAVIVVGDFNDNQLNPHCCKVKDIMRLYNLHQLINEATNFTEQRDINSTIHNFLFFYFKVHANTL